MMKIGLLANAGFSSLTGAALAAFSGWLSSRLGVDRLVLVVLGVGLIGFAARTFAVARSEDPRRARGIVAADLGWVAVAVPVTLLRPGGLTDAGSIALAAVTVVVAALAAMQWMGARILEQR